LSKEVKPLLTTVGADGQVPQALFITCADLRVVPADLANADPGDLFVVRNVGNMVPPYQAAVDGRDDCVGAAVEFAIEQLQIRSIVVCGHSGCGAMKALLAGDHQELDTPLGYWLRHGSSTVEKYRREHAPAEGSAAHNDVARVNVIQQLENLQTYPSVAAALRDGRVRLFGWFVDLDRVKVTVWDEKTGRFQTVEDQYTPPPVMRASA
jgi:carbonic anhydrase